MRSYLLSQAHKYVRAPSQLCHKLQLFEPLCEICMGQFYLVVHNWLHIHVIFLRYTPVYSFIFMLLFLQFENCTSFEFHAFLFLFCPICMVIFIFSLNLFLRHKRFYVYLSCAVEHVRVYCYSTGFAGWFL